MKVQLPSGKVVEIEGIPDNVSDSQIKDEFLRQGLATEEDFVLQATKQEQTIEETTMLQDAGSFLKENLDIPGGIAGGIAGGMAGSVAGPVGTVLGGIAGGAVGTFGGSVLSDYVNNEDPDIESALEEAAVSVGFDVATLGAAKFLKGPLKALGFGRQELGNVVSGLTSGTKESLKATQQLLESGGGSLSAFQTGQASGLRAVAESIGEIGILSRSASRDRRLANVTTIKDNLNDLINGKLGAVPAGSSDVGSEIYGIVEGARQAAIKGYGDELVSLRTLVPAYPVSTAYHVKGLRQLLKENVNLTKTVVREDGVKITVPTSYDLADEATALSKKYIKLFGEAKELNPKNIFSLEKKLNTDISSLLKDAPGDVTRDVLKVRDAFRDATSSMLESMGTDVNFQYRLLNQSYAETIQGILPEINSSAVRSAGNKEYEALGRIATQQSDNVSATKALLNSVDKAFAVLKKEGVALPEGSVDTAFKAKELIKQGYLRQQFGELTSETFDMRGFARLARELEKPKAGNKAKAILGDAYPEYKQLINAISESSREPTGFFGSLIVRGREAGALSVMAGAAVGGVPSGDLALAGAGAAAVLLTPVVLAKIATNKQAVRKLLLLNSQSKKFTGEKLTTFIASNLGKVMEDLPEEVKQEIRISLRTENEEVPSEDTIPQQ